MEFDYVVVGGGAAGCVVAARLSEDRAVSVCLVETGGSGEDIFVRAPAMLAAMLPGMPRINTYAYLSDPQPGLNGRRLYQPRGRALGGSTAINAMLYARGHPADYDAWERLGASGWGWADVRPWFRKLEGHILGEDDWHGGKGPVQVSHQNAPRAISGAFVQACAAAGLPLNADFSGPVQEGAGLYHVTQFRSGPHMGERCSAAAAYLRPARGRSNLTILTRSRAERIVLRDGRACGVLLAGGGPRQVGARREVILSAGVFNTPQVLMLSGIGPGDALKRHGIAPVRALPGVGRNLQDHLGYTLLYRTPRTDVLGLNPAGLMRLLRAALIWRKTGGGLFATPYAEAGAFLKSDPRKDRPDLQAFFMIGLAERHLRRPRLANGYSCHVGVLHPQSRGQVRLASADPAAPPSIDPGYLSDPNDLDMLMRGARLLDRILKAAPLSPWRGDPVHPMPESEADLAQDIRARAETLYHPVGTCAMGMGPEAVVDPELRVHGVEGLRVADASVMPWIVGGTTAPAAMMIGERAAAMIAKLPVPR